ncbi:hypothetical protein CEE69_02155 [Rhodopirellula bahusiensis]|uniref:Uncharacterized protein n=1 Tax=Rhodopirellula bahusiensis TaxID=2014065 RepID=A0A2G1WDT8_9BACT|nr:hypothetical protein CEE69_02155 [Rhodopirellula bahusiensis]
MILERQFFAWQAFRAVGCRSKRLHRLGKILTGHMEISRLEKASCHVGNQRPWNGSADEAPANLRIP